MRSREGNRPFNSYYEWQEYDAHQSDHTIPDYFQNNNGQLDVEKVIETINQVADTCQQFTPLVKEIQSLLKK